MAIIHAHTQIITNWLMSFFLRLSDFLLFVVAVVSSNVLFHTRRSMRFDYFSMWAFRIKVNAMQHIDMLSDQHDLENWMRPFPIQSIPTAYTEPCEIIHTQRETHTSAHTTLENQQQPHDRRNKKNLLRLVQLYFTWSRVCVHAARSRTRVCV